MDTEGKPPKPEQFEDDVLLEGEDGDEPNEYVELDKDSDSNVWLIKVEQIIPLGPRELKTQEAHRYRSR